MAQASLKMVPPVRAEIDNISVPRYNNPVIVTAYVTRTTSKVTHDAVGSRRSRSVHDGIAISHGIAISRDHGSEVVVTDVN